MIFKFKNVRILVIVMTSIAFFQTYFYFLYIRDVRKAMSRLVERNRTLSCFHNVSLSNHYDKYKGLTTSWSTSAIVNLLQVLGCVITMIPTAVLAGKHQSKLILFSAMAMNTFVLAVTPLLAYFNMVPYVLNEFIGGITTGMTIPSSLIIISRWIPKKERTFAYGMLFSTTVWALCVSNSISRFIGESMGWEFICIPWIIIYSIWLLIWGIFFTGFPEEQKYISEEEKLYILASVGYRKGVKYEWKTIPWKSIFQSRSVRGLVATHSLGFYAGRVMLFSYHDYLDDQLQLRIDDIYFLIFIPYVCAGVLGIFVAVFIQWLVNSVYITLLQARKIATTIGLSGCGVVFLSIGILKCQRGASVLLHLLGVMSSVITFSGYLVCFMDISPLFVAVIMAVSDTIMALFSFCVIEAPFYYLLANNDPSMWQIYHLVAAMSCFIAVTIFLFIAKVDEEPWSENYLLAEESFDIDILHM